MPSSDPLNWQLVPSLAPPPRISRQRFARSCASMDIAVILQVQDLNEKRKSACSAALVYRLTGRRSAFHRPAAVANSLSQLPSFGGRKGGEGPAHQRERRLEHFAGETLHERIDYVPELLIGYKNASGI